MELKGRLKLIAEKVPPCGTVCDVGTDHAYIPIYLVLRGRCSRAVASDIKKGPVAAAQKNIRIFQLEERIEARLGGGLETIAEGEADVIVIAGMGGSMIMDILHRDLAKVKKARMLVLQPMKAVETLRQWLYAQGFEITDEELAEEGEKIYNVLCARWTGANKQPDEIFYYIGEQLVLKKDPLLGRLIRKKAGQMEKALREMENKGGSEPEAQAKYAWLREEMLGLLKSI